MGSVRSDWAGLARKAIAARDYKAAEQVLQHGLLQNPADAEMACELAILRCIQGWEGEGFEFLPIARGASRFEFLLQILADHFRCRTLLNSKDFDAQKRLDALSVFNVKPGAVGIKISACLIAKDEEDSLGRCLASIVHSVDEIVVVDTGSSDRTVQIAAEYGAVIGRFDWCDDFAAARNAALQLATGNWILWIDADEELVAGSVNAFHRAVVRPHIGGYDIDIVNFTDDREGGDQFHHSPTRFFQKRREVQFEGRIHEQISPSLVRLKLPISRLAGAGIVHHGYRPSIVAKKGKMLRTTRILTREIEENPEGAFQWFNLANAYLIEGNLAESEKCADKAIQYMDPGVPYAAHAFAIAIQACNGCGHYEKGIELGIQGQELGLDTIGVGFELCQSYLYLNRIEEAYALSERLLGMEWEEGSTGDRGIYTHKRAVLHAKILMVRGEYVSALYYLDSALLVDPHWSVPNFMRATVLEKLGRFDDAIAGYGLSQGDPNFHSLSLKSAGRCYHALARYKEAASCYEAAWEIGRSDSEAMNGWIAATEALGDADAISFAYESIAKHQSLSANLLVNWGRVLEVQGSVEKALFCFAEAIRVQPEYANAYFNGGDLLYRLGSAVSAIDLYTEGLRLAPDYAQGWFTIGNAYAKAGDYQSAIRAFRTALQHDPNHAGAKHNLAALDAPAAEAA